jgi:hypothetical protein
MDISVYDEDEIGLDLGASIAGLQFGGERAS